MTNRPPKPFYIDELTRKHEAFDYDESEAEEVVVEHRGRALRLLLPKYSHPAAYRVGSLEGDLLCLVGKQLDFEEDGESYEGGDGVIVLAHRVRGRDDTFAALVWHSLYDWTIGHLESALDRKLWD